MNTHTIKPETPLEQQLLSSPEFLEGLWYGKPRKGHPEGQVVFHVEEVLANVDKYASPETREKLRFIALVHDTFKYKVDHSKARHGENHHAMIARRFAEGFISDASVLDIIELHDEAYNAWMMGIRGNWKQAEERAQKLITRLGDSVPLYLLFYHCDNKTGNKSGECITWFEDLLR